MMLRVIGVAWFVLSCYGLFLRVPSVGTVGISHMDKVAHFVVFFGQFYLLGRALDIDKRARWVGLWLTALAWAVVSELIQGASGVRTMDVWDGVADMLGATLAVGVMWWRKRSAMQIKNFKWQDK